MLYQSLARDLFISILNSIDFLYNSLLLQYYACNLYLHLWNSADILYDSWSPAMTVSSICISILSMLSSSPAKVCLLFQSNVVFLFPRPSLDVNDNINLLFYFDIKQLFYFDIKQSGYSTLEKTWCQLHFQLIVLWDSRIHKGIPI